MKEVNINFVVGDQDKFEELLAKRIETVNKKKKITNVEIKTAGDYIKKPVAFSTTGVIDLGTGETFLTITNPEVIIGVFFTFEDGTETFEYYNNWGVKGHNFKIGFSRAKSKSEQSEKGIRGILEHWLGCRYLQILKSYPGVWEAYEKLLKEQGCDDPTHKNHSQYSGMLWLRDYAIKEGVLILK